MAMRRNFLFDLDITTECVVTPIDGYFHANPFAPNENV
jgi:hypothetical protein